MLNPETEMVFFDAGETLIHPNPSFPELFSLVCMEHGLEVDFNSLRKASRSLMGNIEGRQRNGYTFTNNPEESRRFWLGFYGRLVRELGYEGDDGDLPDYLYQVFTNPDNYGLYEDVVETLEGLRVRGLRMGVISNFEIWLDGLLEDLQLKEFFDVIVISGREEYEKPHPRIFELSLERSGVEPRLALHVGDSPISDFEGASRVGMQAVLLDRWGRFPDFNGARVTNLLEIASLLG